jgi:hypothetical protein
MIFFDAAAAGQYLCRLSWGYYQGSRESKIFTLIKQGPEYGHSLKMIARKRNSGLC